MLSSDIFENSVPLQAYLVFRVDRVSMGCHHLHCYIFLPPLWQIFIIVQLLRNKIEIRRFSEEERLADTEEGPSQDDTDEQTPHDLLA